MTRWWKQTTFFDQHMQNLNANHHLFHVRPEHDLNLCYISSSDDKSSDADSQNLIHETRKTRHAYTHLDHLPLIDAFLQWADRWTAGPKRDRRQNLWVPHANPQQQYRGFSSCPLVFLSPERRVSGGGMPGIPWMGRRRRRSKNTTTRLESKAVWVAGRRERGRSAAGEGARRKEKCVPSYEWKRNEWMNEWKRARKLAFDETSTRRGAQNGESWRFLVNEWNAWKWEVGILKITEKVVTFFIWFDEFE